ncbi:hypothetical protein F0562_007842 [Nyssa sinensis]|uniref:ABC transporter domain-containing protein n=1 Tax=Nyssa sinensis TaxID=561372 RepID=A0A5J5A7P7_9ASTE|nr:hypothetical protein F0562_007842 [Nyssa sinensis]
MKRILFPLLVLQFEDVKYKIAVKGKKNHTEKCILQAITGSVHLGEVLALMGPSGGGKTTLLDLLSEKVKINSGIITYNDQPFTKSLKRRCQNTIIGGAFVRGISGGERKRVCIGIEILLNPSLLLLDEPTFGLDPTTALQIVQMVHNIAKPSSRLFRKFDKLILLGKGSSLYLEKISEAILYFSSIGCAPLLAMNTAEFLIDLANGNIQDKSVPSDLEDKFLPGSQTLEIQDKRPSPVDVHKFLVGSFELRGSNMGKTKLLQPMMIEGDPEMQEWPNSREWGATWRINSQFFSGETLRIGAMNI